MFSGNRHIFSPADVPSEDEHYGVWVLVEQVRRFGPFDVTVLGGHSENLFILLIMSSHSSACNIRRATKALCDLRSDLKLGFV